MEEATVEMSEEEHWGERRGSRFIGRAGGVWGLGRGGCDWRDKIDLVEEIWEKAEEGEGGRM
jgi:hypothetical protein